MDEMNDMQRILVEDHIQGLEHEAAALRAERERDRHRIEPADAEASVGTGAMVAAAAADAGQMVDVAAIGGAPVPTAALVAATTPADGDSPRVRLGHWLVGVGAAIAGVSEPAAGASVAVAVKAASDGPCDDGPTSLSHAA